MNLQILIKENIRLLEFNISSFPFKTFQNEFGDYEELEGVLNFQNEGEICSVDSSSIISDLYGTFYSINDFLEFEFAHTLLNNEKTKFKYELFDKSIIKLEINDSDWLIDQEKFLLEILNSSFSFFKALSDNEKNEQYKVNLGIIESLAIRLKLEDRLNDLKHNRLS
jgi:hypothetical protein